MVKMPRLSKNDRERAIGLLESGHYETGVTQRLDVHHRTTIVSLSDRFNTTGSSDNHHATRSTSSNDHMSRYHY